MIKKIIKVLICIIVLILLIGVFAFIYYKISFKKDHKLLFTILSDGGYDCEYVKLEIYDDNTYAFYNELVYKKTSDDKLDIVDYEDNPTIGTYKYDTSELLNNLDVISEHGGKYRYIINTPEGNEYYVDSNNKELKKLLRSMLFQKIRVNLNTCPKHK